MSSLTEAEAAAAPRTPAHDPWVKSVRATGSWLRHLRTRVRIREFEFVTDQPLAKGGENTAPTPMEFVAGAVNACITVTIESVAKELDIALEDVETLSRAHMDVRGFAGTADVSPHFSDYALLVQIVTTASEPELAELRRLVDKRCPATNLLRDANVALDLQWQFSPQTFAPHSDDRYRS
ncbi:OsmC family protein [Salinibacterium sp. PAMC 21357]|uniref:OsmC family protein n=1 Tax=Salinibacterium sp. PAMC 21357 TaxID=1112215 RepID=UPI000288F3E0|nr:OsmC family protein [Salinibacterium sp. PAMC 21357]